MGNHLCDPATPVNALFHLRSLIVLREVGQSWRVKQELGELLIIFNSFVTVALLLKILQCYNDRSIKHILHNLYKMVGGAKRPVGHSQAVFGCVCTKG